MTERLYYQDAYIKEFNACVTGCGKDRNQDRYRITLDRSAFYPEGGGQSGDRGVLVLHDKASENAFAAAQIRVLDTQEEGDDIYLICADAVPVGTSVRGILDWEYRFDRMQNHSGEHIVSGLIHERYGYHNVGFHMSQDRMTIDLDGEIPEDGLAEIEKRANEIVWANLPVMTAVYSREEAEGIAYRSKKELEGEIRVVTIPGADVCACCGTHVAHTGEIGVIKILSHERFKGGVRMELACGRWAYEFLAQVFCQNHEVSVHLSSRMMETGSAAKRLVEEHSRLKGDLIGMRYQMIERTAEELEGAGNVVIFAPGMDAVMAQKLTAKVMETCGGNAFAFAGSEEEGYKYAAGRKDGDLKNVIKEMNRALDGRGGGKPFFLQGSVQATRSRIEAYLLEADPSISIHELRM